MATYNFRHSITSLVLRIKIVDTSGVGKTGLTSSSTGLIISTIADTESTATNYTVASSNVETITTLGTFATPTSGKCRFKEVDATNHKGLYEIQIADARWSVSNAKYVTITVSGVTGVLDVSMNVDLTNLPVNVRQIDQQDTSGNNATLNLKCLNVVNNAGDAVVMSSTGSNGNGLEISGNGSGAALRVVGGATGAAATFTGGSTSGAGISVSTTDGIGLNINTTAGSGIYVSSGSTNAVQFVAATTGAFHALRLVAGDEGNAFHAVGGTSSGYGIFASGQTATLREQIVTQIQAGLFTSAGYTAPDNSTISTINSKLGTPAGASVSADIAAAKAVADNTYTIVNTDIYTIKVGFGRDATNSRDEYAVTWLKNGIELTSGITSPTITVRDTSNTALISAQTLTQVGSTMTWKYWESTNRITLGEPYTAEITATIDGSSRVMSAKIARDKE